MKNQSITGFSDMFRTRDKSKLGQRNTSESSAFVEMLQKQMTSSFSNKSITSNHSSPKEQFTRNSSTIGLERANSRLDVKKNKSFKHTKKTHSVGQKKGKSEYETKTHGKQTKKEVSNDDKSYEEAKEKLEKLRKSSKNASFWQNLDDNQALELVQKLQELGDVASKDELADTLSAISDAMGNKADLSKDINIITGSDTKTELVNLVPDTTDNAKEQISSEGILTARTASADKQKATKQKEDEKNAEVSSDNTENVVALSNNAQTEENSDIKDDKKLQANKKLGKGKKIDVDTNTTSKLDEGQKSNGKEVNSLRSEFAEQVEQKNEIDSSTSGENVDADTSNNTSEEKSQGINRLFTLNNVKSEDVTELKQKIVDSFLKPKGKVTAKGQLSPKSFTYTQKVGSSSKSNFNNSSNNSGYGNNSSSYQLPGNKSAQPNASNPTTGNMLFSEILEKAEMLKNAAGQKTMSVELSPDGIGKMTMKLSTKDGGVMARISAEDTDAKEKLDKMIPEIKEQLKEQGINLSEITVDISFKQPDGNSSDKNNRQYNKSERISDVNVNKSDEIIKKNILPHLRQAALNIQSIDVTV